MREPRKRVGKTGRHKNAEPVFWPRTVRLDWLCPYAAALLAAFVNVLAGDLGAAFFAAFTFSLVANSCLIWVEIAATSTL